MTASLAAAERELGPRGALGERYARLMRLIADERCVLLDGGVATELGGGSEHHAGFDDGSWGVRAVLATPASVTALHRGYADAGCDVLSTSTWGLPTLLRDGGASAWGAARPVHWMDVAREAVRLARTGAAQAGRADEVAVAFGLNGDVEAPGGAETIALLARAFEDEPPDLILLETLALVREETYAAVAALLETGVPLWLGFRRCRHGVCGVHGEHWGGPEGDAFGRAARRFERMGVGALLVNCVPPDHVPGMVSWLRDFTDLPLGVYPNLGYLSAAGWRHEPGVGGPQYADLARTWRAEGAQIVGGCCGVGPEHIAAARYALAGTPPGRERPAQRHAGAGEGGDAAGAAAPRWSDAQGRDLHPLDFPALAVDPGVFSPTQGSFLIWKHLYREQIGAGARCLDIGCGSGLLAVQLARNGAAHVHALDLDAAAVANTLTNAFRNGVAERISAEAADLLPWAPPERYDVIVASLYQMPVDPFEHVTTHRPLDFWGRSLLDHLIRLLPQALAHDGVAYVMQLSIIGARRTSELLEAHGLPARVVDFGFFEFHELFRERREQIARVEAQSDAYHLTLGEDEVMVAYLLEISRAPA